MKISISHNLTKVVALVRIKKFIKSLKVKYASDIKDVKETWEKYKGEYRLKIKGFDINASIKVNDKSVSIKGDLPWVLKIFSNKIEEIIKSNLKDVLS